MYWIAIGLAGGSLITSTTILYFVLKMLHSTHRAERAGDERLEILREQQQRLGFLREERRMLEEELRWRRSMMEGEERLPELMAPPDSNGHSRFKQPKLRSLLRHILER